MNVWIDLSNSPHPLLFDSVAAALERDGHRVLVTARDNAQTVELARERWPEAEVIGGESPRGRRAKLIAILARIRNLRDWAKVACPNVALSHNSYAQIVAARSLGIPAVTAMDYEHQPANHLAFRLAHTILIPDVVPLDVFHRQGAARRKVVRYPGLKEELYIGDFEPDVEVLGKLGLSPRPAVVVVVRSPPTRALYHPAANRLFEQALRAVCARPDVTCVTLTRHSEQVETVESLQLANCIVPRHAVDSRSLLYEADAMIGAGGTMTREAALIGIPTWTMFGPEPPAVDRWLESQGLLRRLTDTHQLADLAPRRVGPRPPADLRAKGRQIERVVVEATLAAGNGPDQFSQEISAPTARTTADRRSA